MRAGVPQIYYSQETEILVANLNKPRALSQNLARMVDRSLAIYKKRLDTGSFCDGPDILAGTYLHLNAWTNFGKHNPKSCEDKSRTYLTAVTMKLLIASAGSVARRACP